MGSRCGLNRRELLAGILYACVLLWLNAYICRELFTVPNPHTNSMHGFWTALARLAGASWLHPTWWPYWDCGMPFEFTYQPAVPMLTSLMARVRGVSYQLGFQSVSALVYILLPVTLFFMAWRLTRAPGYAFFAGLAYSLLSPSQLPLPDTSFRLAGITEARRFYVQTVWDETPHLAGMVLLPLIILFLIRSLETHRTRWYVLAAISIAAASLATSFAPVDVAFAAISLLFVLARHCVARNIAVVAGIGAVAWALAAPFYSPSLIAAIRDAAANSYEGRWTAGSWTALTLLILGWAILWHYLPRWTADWRLQFFALFAYAMSAIPILSGWLNRQFLPQPGRYKNELEFALCLLVVFASRAWIQKLPKSVRVCLVLLFLSLSGELLVSHRRIARATLGAVDVTRTIEFRAPEWVARNLPGTRVMMPGSIAQWTNSSTDIFQFTGSSWSTAYSQVQQRAQAAVFKGGGEAEQGTRAGIAWLKAFGVGAVVVSGPGSGETWKPYAHPAEFAKLLPVLWSEDDVTVYRIPQASPSLAHVVPENAIVLRTPSNTLDTAAIEAYNAALDDRSLPAAALRWEGRNRLRIATSVAPGQALSIQVSHHPGWHATVNGKARQIGRDGLGLIWLRPECQGRCDVVLEYDGGWELRICRYLSFSALLLLAAVPLWLLANRPPREPHLRKAVSAQ
jgi:hypothetical protein